MRRALLLLILLLIVHTASLAAGPFSADGTVVDLHGKPVAGVRVHAVLAWNGGGLVPSVAHSIVNATVVSGKGGSFHFRRLPAPKTSLGYCFVAYDPGKWLGWTVCEGGDLYAREWSNEPEPDSYTVVVGRPETRKGLVVDAAGKGIPGVTVTPTNMSMPGGRSSTRVEHIAAAVKMRPAVTDTQGRYVLTGIPQGARITPSASRFGYATVEFAQIVDGRIIMEPGGDISGRVVDERGKGVPGVPVTASGGQSGSYGHAVTQGDGSYRIPGLKPGEYGVGPLVVGRLLSVIGTVRVSAKTVTRAPSMMLGTGIVVSGRVIDADTGRPAKGVGISLYDGVSERPAWACVISSVGDDGKFRLYAKPGKAMLRCDVSGGVYTVDAKPVIVEVPATGMTGYDVKLHRAPTAKGSVVDELGRPVVNASLRLFQGDSRSGDSAGYTDAKGRFQFKFRKAEQPGGG